MKKEFLSDINEIIYKETSSNGLTMYFLPKNSYFKTQVGLGVKLGSFNECGYAIPNGTAHFLEHQSFHNSTKNMFETFSDEGASVNAYTNFTSTVFTLEVSKNVENNINRLIDMVMTPYFNTNMINQERKIINSELELYSDNIDWKARFRILKNMYKIIPIKEEIGGNKNSLDMINDSTLMNVHRDFYRTDNMVLFVAGPISPRKLSEDILKNMKKKYNLERNNLHDKGCYKEPKGVNKYLDSLTSKKASQSLYVGLKYTEELKNLYGCLKSQIMLEILFETIFKSGDSFKDCTASIQIDHNIEKGFGYSILKFEVGSNNTTNIINETKKILQNFDIDQSNYNIFKTKKKKVLGEYISSLNSLEYTMNRFINNHFKEEYYFSIPQKIKSIQKKDVLNFWNVLKNNYDVTFLIVSK